MAWHRSLLEQLTTSSEQQLPPNISHQGCIVCTSIRVKDLSHLSREMTMSRCITTVFYCTSSLLLWMHFASRSVAQSICKTAFYPDVMPWETERWRVAEHSLHFPTQAEIKFEVAILAFTSYNWVEISFWPWRRRREVLHPLEFQTYQSIVSI